MRMLLIVPIALMVLGCSQKPALQGQEVSSPEPSEMLFKSPKDNLDVLSFRFHVERFLHDFMSSDGRVIDFQSKGSVSTSEGQAYGMFFSLVANEPEAFAKMLNWTELNLTSGGLDTQLPAWLWGYADEEQQWQVLDENPATDADVWMAYSLIEAGRLWERADYTALGKLLAERILRELSLSLEGQLVLLPAPSGFVHEDRIRLNPSYASLTIFRGLAATHGDERWLQIYDSSLKLLTLNSEFQNGLYSDWLDIDFSFSVHPETNFQGSYDAIRTYLWLYLEYQYQPEIVRPLIEASLPLVDYIRQQLVPPEHIVGTDFLGTGSVGFSIVLAPYLEILDAHLAKQQYKRLVARGERGYDRRYYDTVLILFGLGATQCFAFDDAGLLKVNWHAPNC